MTQQDHKWEPRDVDVASLLIIALLIILGTGLSAIAAGGLFHALALHTDAAERQPAAVAKARENFPAPRLQVSPEAEFATYRAAQEHELLTYGWLDQAHGTVRLPIERAMDLLLERGLPKTPPAGTDLQFRQREGAMAK